MGKPVRMESMTPEFVKDIDAAYLGELVKRLIQGEETPFGIVLIGSHEEAQRFAEQNLWHFAPPESVEG